MNDQNDVNYNAKQNMRYVIEVLKKDKARRMALLQNIKHDTEMLDNDSKSDSNFSNYSR
jgi:hypothetical protein